jgi:hypothetical protein
MKRTHQLLTIASLLLVTGCADIRHSLAWQTQPFVRIPAPLPQGYDDHRNPMVSARGWNFRHVVACSTKHQPEAHWWMAWPEDPSKLKLGKASWLRLLFRGNAIKNSDWKKIAALTPEIADATMAKFKVYPQMVQPELIFRHAAAEQEIKRSRAEDSAMATMSDQKRNATHLELGALPSGPWAKGKTDEPPYDPIWNHSPEYSQLAEAKSIVRKSTGTAGGGIRVGILDVGYNAEHLLVPKHTLASNGQPGGDRKGELLGDAINVLACATSKDACSISRPGDTNGEHGMKAMSLLAGGAFPLQDAQSNRRNVISKQWTRQPVEIGGAPDATVVPARIAPWVFSHSTANLAYAIDYASRVQQCDVISMSHGGTPSAMWIDAVNAAYDRGTAIFAATGDYINVPAFNLGIGAPSATVFPAACRRVQGVTGITANGEPYGKADWKHYAGQLLSPKNWFLLRGSFGADGGYRDWFHMSPESMNCRTDRPEIRYGGLLRAQTISTWSPNVASAQPPNPKQGFNTLNLDWDGTSAATPQAAAAAVLWLAQHRAEIEKSGHWKDWQKAEAVYVAMLKSSGAFHPHQAAVPIAQRRADLYGGAGTLKAADMLKVSFADARSTQIKNQLVFSARGMCRDYYDGQRSGAAILGYERTFAPYAQRADILRDSHHLVTASAERENALTIIFYNQRLAQQWNNGRIPLKDPQFEKAPAAEMDQSSPNINGTPCAEPKRVRPNWLSRLFSPDAPQLYQAAQSAAAHATNSN